MPFAVVKAIARQGQVEVAVAEVVENTQEALEDLQRGRSSQVSALHEVNEGCRIKTTKKM